MKCFLPVLLGFAISVAGVRADDQKPGELTDPVEILKKVDAAAKAVKAVTYKATYERKGASASQSISLEGSVAMTGWTGNGPEKMRVDANVKQGESSDVRRIEVGGDGETFFVVDYASKKAYEDIDPAVVGRTGGIAQQLVMLEYLHNAPFSDEINGKKQELRGSKTIGGEDCYEIFVQYANVDQGAVWHFSKKDFLPRARRNMFKGPDGAERGDYREITNLVVDPKLDGAFFKLTLPEGFEKVDDFAP